MGNGPRSEQDMARRYRLDHGADERWLRVEIALPGPVRRHEQEREEQYQHVASEEGTLPGSV